MILESRPTCAKILHFRFYKKGVTRTCERRYRADLQKRGSISGCLKPHYSLNAAYISCGTVISFLTHAFPTKDVTGVTYTSNGHSSSEESGPTGEWLTCETRFRKGYCKTTSSSKCTFSRLQSDVSVTSPSIQCEQTIASRN